MVKRKFVIDSGFCLPCVDPEPFTSFNPWHHLFARIIVGGRVGRVKTKTNLSSLADFYYFFCIVIIHSGAIFLKSKLQK